MKDLTQAQEKEFRNKFSDSFTTLQEMPVGSFIMHRGEVFNWHKSSTKALLEAVIEMVEGVKKKYSSQLGTNTTFELEDKLEALTDLQDKLKEEMSKI